MLGRGARTRYTRWKPGIQMEAGFYGLVTEWPGRFWGVIAEGALKRVRGWSHTTQRYQCLRKAQVSWSSSPLPLLVRQFDMAARRLLNRWSWRSRPRSRRNANGQEASINQICLPIEMPLSAGRLWRQGRA